DVADDRLLVHSIVERLAHAFVVEGFVLGVKANVEEAERRSADNLKLLVLRIGTDLVRLLAGDQSLFQVSLEEIGKLLLKGAADSEHHSVQKRPPLVVLVIGLQHDFLVGLPADKFERPSAYRGTGELLPLLFHD